MKNSKNTKHSGILWTSPIVLGLQRETREFGTSARTRSIALRNRLTLTASASPSGDSTPKTTRPAVDRNHSQSRNAQHIFYTIELFSPPVSIYTDGHTWWCCWWVYAVLAGWLLSPSAAGVRVTEMATLAAMVPICTAASHAGRQKETTITSPWPK